MTVQRPERQWDVRMNPFFVSCAPPRIPTARCTQAYAPDAPVIPPDDTWRRRGRALRSWLRAPETRRAMLAAWLALCALCAVAAARYRVETRSAAVSASAGAGTNGIGRARMDATTSLRLESSARA